MVNEYRKYLEKEMPNYSNGKLIDFASDFNKSGLVRKIYEIWAPNIIVCPEKEIAQDILKNRGIDYKITQNSRADARKRLNKMKWNKFKKEIKNPFLRLKENFSNLFSIPYNIDSDNGSSTNNQINYSLGNIKEITKEMYSFGKLAISGNLFEDLKEHKLKYFNNKNRLL